MLKNLFKRREHTPLENLYRKLYRRELLLDKMEGAESFPQFIKTKQEQMIHEARNNIAKALATLKHEMMQERIELDLIMSEDDK